MKIINRLKTVLTDIQIYLTLSKAQSLFSNNSDLLYLIGEDNDNYLGSNLIKSKENLKLSIFTSNGKSLEISHARKELYWWKQSTFIIEDSDIASMEQQALQIANLIKSITSYHISCTLYPNFIILDLLFLVEAKDINNIDNLKSQLNNVNKIGYDKLVPIINSYQEQLENQESLMEEFDCSNSESKD